MLKKLVITTALAGLMIGPAAAQTAASNAPAATTQSTRADIKSQTGSAQVVPSQKSDQFLASKFRGTDVIGADNQKIGSVNDLLFNKDGQIEAYVISAGGFLGMGSKDVALPPSSFQLIPGDKSKFESDKLRLSMTAEQIKQAQNFEPYNPPRPTTGPGTTPRPSPMGPSSANR